MSRSSLLRPSQRADGHSVSPEPGGTTTVAIRLRPLNEREKTGGRKSIWRCSNTIMMQLAAKGSPTRDTTGRTTSFSYDRVFDDDSTTEEVYDGVAREIVHSVVRGLNGTILAYGQTSSGKTFTMQGGDGHETPGIVQLATRDMFQQMKETSDRVFLVRASYVEIYQEDIRDLLNPESSKLQVRGDPRKGVYIEAHEKVVSDFDSVVSVLKAGEKQRHVGHTKMNSRSSRSHTIFRLVVESRERYVPGTHVFPEDVDPAVLVATLNLVDLAGSEGVGHVESTGLRQKEGGKINQSLLALSRVIQSLSQGGGSHVNYRDSKLTRILQPSLSGNAGMAIICCATAAEGFLKETRSTLQFASRAKQIKTCAMVNKVLDDKAQLRRMSRELDALKRQQTEWESGSALMENLQAEKAEQAAKIERLKNLLNLAPIGEDRELHLAASPRYRIKRSRESWSPGGGVPRIPLLCGEGDSSPTPGFMSLACARAQHDVDEMCEKLSAVQAERDARSGAAAAAAPDAECSRVKQLEAMVTERDHEVLSLKRQLDAASKAKTALDQKLDEFVELNELRDSKMVEMEKEMVRVARKHKIKRRVIREMFRSLLKENADERRKAEATAEAANAANACVSMKDDVIVELRQQLNSVSCDADAKTELRRLKDNEMDRVVRECAGVCAELKETKGMLNAAEDRERVAGVEKVSLLERVSQLECENGLLRCDESRSTVATFETRIQKLEDDLRCAEASKSGIGWAVHESIDRVKRLQRELETVRWKCKIVSEDAMVAGEGQHAVIAASHKQIRTVEEAFVNKKEALDKLQASWNETKAKGRESAIEEPSRGPSSNYKSTPTKRLRTSAADLLPLRRVRSRGNRYRSLASSELLFLR